MTVHRVQPTTARGAALASKDRADHPNAKLRACYRTRSHGPHPWGAIHEHGGLEHWCRGTA